MDKKFRKHLLLGGANKLLKSIVDWQGQSILVNGGGLPAARFANNSSTSPAANDYCTIINTSTTERIRQDGFVYGAKIYFGTTYAPNSIKFIVLRKNGTNYDLIGQTEPLACQASQVATYLFTTPIQCLIGDYFGIVARRNGATNDSPQTRLINSGGSTTAYKYADVTSSNTLTSLSNYIICIEPLTRRPYVCVTGDSIPAGWTERQSWYDAFTGDVVNDPAEQLQLLTPILNYQNHSKGAQTWAWVRSTGVVSAIATSPKYIIFHCGVNDINNSRTWTQVEADMNAIKVLCDAAGVTMLIDEILPWTNGTDAQVATVRTWNTNYETWCLANNVPIIKMHDVFGKIRTSTGQLDDLATAYNSDGVHITLAGKQKMAELWKAKLGTL